MILDLRETKTEIDEAWQRMQEDKDLLFNLSKMFKRRLSKLPSNESERQSATLCAEFSARFDSAVSNLDSAIWAFYTIGTRFDEIIKAEDAKVGGEVATLKAQIEEQKKKVADLFQLDQQNCELKRQLRELRGESSDTPEQTQN